MNESLLQVLEKTLTYLKCSKNDSSLSAMSVTEIITVIEKEIDNIKNSKPLDTNKLKLQFLPTSYLQETAIANDWSDEYLQISDEFDEAIVADTTPGQRNALRVRQIFFYLGWGLIAVIASIIMMIISGMIGWGI